MRIAGLKKYRGRNPQGYFEELPWEVRQRAYGWLHHLMQKGRAERGGVPRWLFALYVGQAKRLARTTPEERRKWGRSMLGRRGGLAVQRRYRQEGRHPTANATLCRTTQQRAVKATRQPGFRRTWTNLEGT